MTEAQKLAMAVRLDVDVEDLCMKCFEDEQYDTLDDLEVCVACLEEGLEME